MQPINFPESNFTFGKPIGWTDEQCSSLPVWKGEAPIDDKGNTAPTIVSCWLLSDEEKEEIQRTGVVWLYVTGNGTPPVSMGTQHPFVKQ